MEPATVVMPAADYIQQYKDSEDALEGLINSSDIAAATTPYNVLLNIRNEVSDLRKILEEIIRINAATLEAVELRVGNDRCQ